MTSYRTSVVALCPVNDSRDVYETTIFAPFIEVESLLEATRKYADTKWYQEALTEDLAETLSARVTTRGSHSGVDTLCEADAAL